MGDKRSTKTNKQPRVYNIAERERKECHCMLFLTPDNEFSGDAQKINLEYLIDQIQK